MDRRDTANLIKNIYDQETIDTLRALDQNILALMRDHPDFRHIEIHQYERVPLKPGSPQSQIRVDISRDGFKASFFLSEELVTRLTESNEIRRELQAVMNQIKSALQPKTK